MAKRKISATEKKLRAELRADQNRLKKLENQVAKNWKFGTEGAGKKALEINARIEAKKQKLARFGYKGAKEVNYQKRAKNVKAFEKFNFGNAWDKKDTEKEILKVIRPNEINGKNLKTNLPGAVSEINNLIVKMTSKDTLKGVLTLDDKLIVYIDRNNAEGGESIHKRKSEDEEEEEI